MGSRDYADLGKVRHHVSLLAKKYPDAIVVSGGARGVDRAAEVAAQILGLGFISYRPYKYTNMAGLDEWSIETVTWPDEHESNERRINPPFFGSFVRAAFGRNTWIVEDGDVLVAFHRDESRGTADSVRKARALGHPVFLY